MIFPDWTLKQNKKKLKKAEQASARLRFLMNTLANLNDPSATFFSLAKTIGINHTTISAYIMRGAFSQPCADRFEAHFGPEVCKAIWLTAPLDIQ